MQKVTVRRLGLLEKIKENRLSHRKDFDDAMAIFRNRCVEEMENRIRDMK